MWIWIRNLAWILYALRKSLGHWSLFNSCFSTKAVLFNRFWFQDYLLTALACSAIVSLRTLQEGLKTCLEWAIFENARLRIGQRKRISKGMSISREESCQWKCNRNPRIKRKEWGLSRGGLLRGIFLWAKNSNNTSITPQNQHILITVNLF